MLPTISGEFGIVQEPELRFNDEGVAWAKLRGKWAERKQDKDGNWVDGEVGFIDIIVSRKLAENCVESISKATTVSVVGTLSYREWEDNEGRKQKSYTIRATSIGVTPRFGAVKAVDQAPVSQKPSAPFSEEAPF